MARRLVLSTLALRCRCHASSDGRRFCTARASQALAAAFSASAAHPARPRSPGHHRLLVRRPLGAASGRPGVEIDPLDPSGPLLDPLRDLCSGGLPVPSSLSPSAVGEFRACPQSYLFQYLLGLRQPTNEALARGSLCHSALEKVYDLDPDHRTRENLRNLLRAVWAEERLSDRYRHLFEVEEEAEEVGGTRRDLEAEIRWGKSGLALLDRYVDCEDPRAIPAPNPLEREMWVRSRLAGGGGEKFLVRGIVDRIDLVQGDCLRIVDYKTGKCPDFKYSPATNERIADEAFFQLKIYALLLREMVRADQAAPDGEGGEKKKGGGLPFNLRSGIPVRRLRLLYLTSNSGEARYLDMDLGETAAERDAILDAVRDDLVEAWTAIGRLVRTNDPRSFVHCDRPFCWCHKVRHRFEPGTVWERERPPSEAHM